MGYWFWFQFDQGGLGMPSRDYFLDSRYSSQLNAYRKFTTEIAIALGGDKATSARDMNDMVDFEISLANVGLLNVVVVVAAAVI